MPRRVFISADHGTAIIYFLQSDVVPTLLANDVEVVLLTDDQLRDAIQAKFGRPGLAVEGLRLQRAAEYAATFRPRLQWLLSSFLRRVGGSWKINTEAMDSHIWEVWKENSWKFRFGVWLPAVLAILFLRTFPPLRRMLVEAQSRFQPRPALYGDLFDRYRPDLVIASTAGWRLDRYLLREATTRGVPTMAAIVGWDNPSSYAIRGARLDYVTCWSDLQRDELHLGSDWPRSRVHVGGIPSYDGYVRRTWLIPRAEYFSLHGLEPDRKLIAYACSFVHFAPNLPNVEALAALVSSEELTKPAQLLVRLHPSHFQTRPGIFEEERRRIEALARQLPHVHVVQPVPLGGSLGYYSGEDMPEKASMMAHADVFVTVYSTMVVETAIHDTPIIAAVLDTPGGWNQPRKYSLSLRSIGNWPTHQRFREAGAGRVAGSPQELKKVLNAYLQDRSLDSSERRRFAEQEITYMDGSAGRRTAEYVLSLLGAKSKSRGVATQEVP